MEGLYDFDARGIAKALLAPVWSVAALEEVQAPLALAVRSLGDAQTSERKARLDLERALLVFERHDRKTAKRIWNELEGRDRPWIQRLSHNLLAAIGAIVTLRDGGELAYGAADQIGEIVRILQGG